MFPPALSRHEAIAYLYAIEGGYREMLYEEVATFASQAARAVAMRDVVEVRRLLDYALFAARMCRRGKPKAIGFYMVAYVLVGARWA